MNVESTNISKTQEVQPKQQQQAKNETDAKFSEELKGLKDAEAQHEKEEAAKVAEKSDNAEQVASENSEAASTSQNQNQIKKNVDSAIHDLTSVLNEINNSDEKVNRFGKVSQKDDKNASLLKNINEFDDNNEEGEDVINNDFSIDNKDKLPQMNLNMSFGGDGQPFSSFMNSDSGHSQGEQKLSSSAKDLAEEAEILSTMAENVAMANKMQAETSDVKVVNRNDGVKKVNTKTNIVQETIVKYDTVVMNEADVEVFANLVQNGEVDMNNLAPEAAQKSVQVSKTLADMLAKAMDDNKPVRIEFDNGISVIIKISRDGKLSADFLPSTQVAEAYLKENLPLLRQRFEEQNLEYDELNQRERRNPDREQNRKKGNEDE